MGSSFPPPIPGKLHEDYDKESTKNKQTSRSPPAPPLLLARLHCRKTREISGYTRYCPETANSLEHKRQQSIGGNYGNTANDICWHLLQ